MKITATWPLALLLLSVVAAAAIQSPATPPAETPQAETPHPATSTPKRSGRSIPLLPGTCPQVTPGDELVLEWNLAFDVPGGATGAQNLLLSFRKVGQTDPDPQGHREFLLRATFFGKRAHQSSEITQLPNGFLQFRFEVPHQDVEPGEYHIATARSLPRTPEDQAVNAKMTNSPVNFPFCLNVVTWLPSASDLATAK